MVDNWNYDADEDDEQQQGQGDGPADLRKAHRAATRELKALKATLAEKDQEITSLTKRVRSIDIAGFLPEGVNPKIAKLIPESVDSTAEAVKAWLDEYGDAFNIKATPAGDTGNSGDDDRPEPTGDYTSPLDQETLAALAAFTDGSSGGSAIPAGAASALLADVANAGPLSMEDGLKLLAKHGLNTVAGY